MSNYKRIFLDGYSYYLTIVTHQRNPILLENIALLRESFRVSKSKYDYDINDIIILPDHFHMIITPKIPTQYPQIIRAIKYHFSKHLDERYYVHLKQSFSRTRRGSKPIWQKRYYEHTIRDEKDYMEKITYMYQNPVKHKYVTDAKQWEYSSFQK
jgi:putative transposase